MREVRTVIDATTLSALTAAVLAGPATTNSTEVGPGSVFFALVGARDGHDFLDDAVRAGAGAVVVSKPYTPPVDGVEVISVPDTLEALQAAGGAVRQHYDVDALAVTGSVGKTTTKNLLTHLLAASRPVLSSPKSFNNHLGVPLTLLSLDASYTDLVAEIGTNHPGEIAALVRLVRPRAALVTNVGFAHLGNFGSREALADEKVSLFTGVAPDGVWFVNADDPILLDAVGRLDRPATTRVVTFGTAADADVRVSDVAVTESATTGVVHVGGESLPFTFPLVGRHFGGTVASAVAIAVERGIPAADAVALLATFPGSEGRASVSTIRDGAMRLIDDSYNGSPDSMLAALDTLSTFPEDRRIAVLGEMRELGDWTEAMHTTVGTKAGSSATDLVFIGPSEPVVRRAATAAGLPDDRIHAAASAPEAAALVEALLAADPGATSAVLVKGSRFVHTERVPLVLDGTPVGCMLALCELYIHCSKCPKVLTG
ncbi:UDP-N-acetylmuramoyl-tripeptide--D-alanyl-D-alanine ligase [Nocardioides ginsengisoli]